MKTNLKDLLEKYNQALSFYLRPSTFPVAIKMVDDLAMVGPKAKRPKKQLGINMFLCQAINVSRRNGWSIYLDKNDISCASALFYLGLAKAPEAYWRGEFVFAPYNQTPQARARRSRSFPSFPLKKYKGILISPLIKSDFEPDSVLIYGNPAQMMRLTQACVFKSGAPLNFKAQGGGSCSFEVVGPVLTNKASMVLPGNGERIFGQVHDDEMVFAIPFHKMKDIVAYLEQTHKGGQRYPVPKYATFTPELPSDYVRLLKTVRKGG